MNAGFKVFSQQGFPRTTISHIAREAGKSNGVFHIYFKNKAALLDAWLDEADTMVPWHHADASLLFEKARRFVLKSFWNMYDCYGAVLEALDAAAFESDHFKARRRDVLHQSEASIARMIRCAQNEGRCLGIDPELTAISISAVIRETTAHWFHHRASMEARGIDQAKILGHLEALFTRMSEPDSASPAKSAAAAIKIAG